MVHKNRVKLIYYAVFAGGVILLGSYFWMLFTTTTSYGITELMLYGSAILLIVMTFALALTTTRAGRTVLTMGSGAFTGAHGYLLVTKYTAGFTGATLFAWLMFGLLLSFSAFFWFRELQRSAT